MNKQSDITCEGIILRVIRYKNSHAIFKFITPNLGIIQCSVKGLTNKKNNLSGTISNLNYLNLELSKVRSSDIYNLKGAHLITTLAAVNDYESFKYQSAACELFTKIDDYLEEDYLSLFRLLLNYLNFIPSVGKNHIALFWRFLIHYYYILGIPFDLLKCNECSQLYSDSLFYSLDSKSLVCPDCAMNQNILSISKEAQKILLQLPSIGNIINQVTIEDATKKEINKILLSHLSHSLHKDIYLKSIIF